MICRAETLCVIQICSCSSRLKSRASSCNREPSYSAVTVDLVKGDAARSNMFPESADIEISTAALIPRLVTDAAAIEAARKLVLRWLRHKYKVYKSPRIDVVKQQEVYKAFFYTQNHKGEDILVDSVRGIKLLDND